MRTIVVEPVFDEHPNQITGLHYIRCEIARCPEIGKMMPCAGQYFRALKITNANFGYSQGGGAKLLGGLAEQSW